MITARGKSAVSVLDLRLQGGDHNRSMGLIIVRGGGVPAVCIRAKLRGSLLTVLWVSIRPTSIPALPPSSTPPFMPGGGVGLAWRVSFLSVFGAFCRCSAVQPPRGSWCLVGIGLWFCASWEIDARSFASFPAISLPVQSRPNFWYSLLGVPW